MTNKYATYGSDSTQADTGVANGLRETLGPTNLIVGTITDGEFLKRSGNTIISAAAGAGATGPTGPQGATGPSSSSSWTTAYSVDFTALGATADQNLKTGGNGSKTINGQTYTWANDANATSADLTNGTGIMIVLNTTNSNYGGATRTTPILTIPFQSVFTGYSILNHIVRIRARVLLTNCDANTEGVRLVIEDVSAPTNQNVNYFKGFSTITNQHGFTSTISGVSTTQTLITSTDDVIGLVWEGPKNAEWWSGTFSSGILNCGNLQWSESQNMANPLMFKPAQPRFGIGAGTANVAGSFTAIFTHLIVDYCSKHPAP